MFAELIDSIVGLAHRAKDAKVLSLPGGTHYALQSQGGSIEIRTTPRQPVEMNAHDISSFVKLMKTYCAAVDHPNASGPIITVEVDGDQDIVITGYPSGLVQDDNITCMIRQSPEFQAMSILGNGVAVPEFVRLVRRELFENVPTTLLEQVRQIDFVETSRTNMVVQNSGRESMGKSVEMRTTANHADVPDAAYVEFPVVRTDVPVAGLHNCEANAIVQVDTKNQKISLILPKNGLAVAMEAAAKAIAGELQGRFDRLAEENAISLADGDVIQVVYGC